MTCLSLIQPWATLWATGFKTIETRSCPTQFRGELFIHASKTFSPEGEKLYHHFFKGDGHDRTCNYIIPSFESLPRGVILGKITITDCLLMTDSLIKSQLPSELKLGDWKPGRFAWIGKDPELLPSPIQAKGSLQLWTFDPAQQAREEKERQEELAFQKEAERQRRYDRNRSRKLQALRDKAARLQSIPVILDPTQPVKRRFEL